MKKLSFVAFLALAGCGLFSQDESGGLCGVPGLEGERIGDVAGKGACGIEDAVRVTRVAGISLSQGSRMTCEAATSLDRWVRDAAIPAIGNKGGGLAQLKVAAEYSCRTRNNRRGAKLSEHAKGNAIDISAFLLKDGSQLTVLNDWTGANSSTMRQMHGEACGPYGTVLGPNSDRYHRDHFHFDVADYRSGPYCR